MSDTSGASLSDAMAKFRWLLHAGWFVPILAVILLVLYSAQFSRSKFMSSLSISLLIALSALVSGLLLGFLFGIPRSLQQQSAITTGLDNVPSYAVNTNLEQISDWLTKILVGIGLIQVGRIGSQFGKLTTALGESIGTNPEGRLVAGTDILFFVVWGFLLGYLLTRTFLTAAFRVFDVAAIATRAARVAVTEVNETQGLIDARALSLASDILTPGTKSPDLPDPDKVRQFEEVLPKASLPIREQIYQMARSQRAYSWQWKETKDDPETIKNRHERTVPVLEALVKVAPRDHRIQGDLGFALKDQEHPDYSESVRHLSIAIDLATKQGDQRSLAGDQRSLAWYSINRVIARINLGNQIGQTAPWPDRAEMWADLDRAEKYGGGPGRIARGDRTVKTWRSQNLQDASP